jgi:hypothetical protein
MGIYIFFNNIYHLSRVRLESLKCNYEYFRILCYRKHREADTDQYGVITLANPSILRLICALHLLMLLYTDDLRKIIII